MVGPCFYLSHGLLFKVRYSGIQLIPTEPHGVVQVRVFCSTKAALNYKSRGSHVGSKAGLHGSGLFKHFPYPPSNTGIWQVLSVYCVPRAAFPVVCHNV